MVFEPIYIRRRYFVKGLGKACSQNVGKYS